MKRIAGVAAVAASAVLVGSDAAAHSVWAIPETPSGTFRVVFGGHGDRLEAYAPQKLKSVLAWNAAGTSVVVQRTVADDIVRLKPEKAIALLALHYDNGIHARTPEGRSVNQPMNAVPGSTRATNAIKYHKLILTWNDFVTRPVGQPFEVTPLEPQVPVAGRPLKVRVTLDGEPAVGVSLGRGEDRIETRTDAAGIAAVVPVAGFNRIWAGQRIPVTGNVAYTELSYEYAFTFEVN